MAGTGETPAELLKQGAAALQAGDLAEAGRCFEAVLGREPDNFDALHLLGVVKARQRCNDEALRLIDKAAGMDPRSAPVQVNRGNVLKSLHRHDEALASYDRALAIKPDHVPALFNRGVVLQELRRPAEALASYDRALALKPDHAEALNNRGTALLELMRPAEALSCCDRLLALRPGFAEAHFNRGYALRALERFDDAVAAFERTVAIDPGYPNGLGQLLYSRLECCAWDSFEAEVARLRAGLRADKPVASPLVLVALSDSASEQLRCTRRYARDRFPAAPAPLYSGERYGHDRIRVAYCSADFREHATAYLTAELFERHDRTRFETTALSFGPPAPGAMRARLESAFDRFIDARQESDRDAAMLIRDMEIDIAVDLGGFTQDSRTGVFALRPAPVQVNYLGFPATMGANYIDYIVADRYAIPEDRRAHYAEKVVYLPDTFHCTDTTRRIAAGAPTRAEAGLPETGFVFCCFNNTYKIAPSMFDAWMRLLQRAEGSVLWLLAPNPAVAGNLRREAERRGVAASRLIFAPRVGYADYLARYRTADLFLDTLPFNAGTTASDALWAGLPLVTCAGEAFASRMAGSVLHAAGLPELVAGSLAEYEAMALKLARDGAALAAIKQKLARNRTTQALFDTDRFRRHIEAAYRTMWRRHRRGEPPASFAVEPIG